MCRHRQPLDLAPKTAWTDHLVLGGSESEVGRILDPAPRLVEVDAKVEAWRTVVLELAGEHKAIDVRRLGRVDVCKVRGASDERERAPRVLRDANLSEQVGHGESEGAGAVVLVGATLVRGDCAAQVAKLLVRAADPEPGTGVASVGGGLKVTEGELGVLCAERWERARGSKVTPEEQGEGHGRLRAGRVEHERERVGREPDEHGVRDPRRL